MRDPFIVADLFSKGKSALLIFEDSALLLAFSHLLYFAVIRDLLDSKAFYVSLEYYFEKRMESFF